MWRAPVQDLLANIRHGGESCRAAVVCGLDLDVTARQIVAPSDWGKSAPGAARWMVAAERTLTRVLHAGITEQTRE